MSTKASQKFLRKLKEQSSKFGTEDVFVRQEAVARVAEMTREVSKQPSELESCKAVLWVGIVSGTSSNSSNIISYTGLAIDCLIECIGLHVDGLYNLSSLIDNLLGHLDHTRALIPPPRLAVFIQALVRCLWELLMGNKVCVYLCVCV
eukprot:GHVR01179506.1.p1 GENE.GHVR01179506.1~~GHVR01179506.1.p1  ORF type:complete len:148 (+),score=22.90 GHVR01179506.1:155-598(+)